ncbi:protein of unknown function [Dethiosulfatibacter aminovorans DSM 17477]|uniref:DUF4342 domain-containing protein n=1 Tax=Dethiosulfatibacter aminovorans DSM 17477 TaxID=1121476 RepID=A0A1M6DSQ5_9FIRM|nr:DUF4342 domain-containing protein [Dethiosulfatibacter aminovorans]SHI76286.1 protein of unknown function [Dethiosulfatibacter aminovorans DSM 17477]
MFDDLKKVDEIIKRTNCSYEDARGALLDSGGDLLAAIIYVERKKSTEEKLKARSEDVIDEIKKAIVDANASKLVVKKGDEILINIPVSAGVIGAVLAPLFSVAGITAAMVSNYEFDIYTKDGNKINLNSKLEESLDRIDKSINKIKDEFNIHKK